MLTIKKTINDAADAMTDATTEKAAVTIRCNVKLPDAAKTGAPCSSSNYAAKMKKTAAAVIDSMPADAMHVNNKLPCIPTDYTHTARPRYVTLADGTRIEKARQITISNGNKKTGKIKSVSLLPIVTCRKNAPCINDCYACGMCERRENVAKSYRKNTELAMNDRDNYFNQITLAMQKEQYFRFHVSGDIPDADYFTRVVKAAKAAKNCRILIFTKKYEIVNDYLNAGHRIPKNLQIILSAWGAWRPVNPYRLPTTDLLQKGQPVPDGYFTCPGNCENCNARGVGCWQLKKGQTVAFLKHGRGYSKEKRDAAIAERDAAKN